MPRSQDSHYRLRVLLTVDTEFWPSSPNFSADITRDLLRPDREHRRDILGETARGSYGLPFQLQLLQDNGLRAVYFVESLAASVVGLDLLRRTVELIRNHGQEVQLHVHSEWLRVEPNLLLPGRRAQSIRQLPLEEQRLLLACARDNLIEAGCPSVTAYRAGNFGANWDTLRALAEIGIRYDSSYNSSLIGRACDMPTPRPLFQPEIHDGVWEIPISCFEDRPGHLRHVQIGACSFGELAHTLQEAWRHRWSYFVIVTHSNELLNAGRTGPNPIVVKRYRQLCSFLRDHGDRFETITFSDIQPNQLSGVRQPERPIRSGILRTAHRMGEQLAQRFL